MKPQKDRRPLPQTTCDRSSTEKGAGCQGPGLTPPRCPLLEDDRPSMKTVKQSPTRDSYYFLFFQYYPLLWDLFFPFRQVLYENNFTYDATMTYPFPRNVFSPVMWPFTLDYSYTLVCNIQPCPKQTYPGLWVIPVVVMMDYREHLPCAYVDHCTNEPRNQYESFEMLWKNFLRNYRTNRAPVYVNLHSLWLETDFHMEAMDEFIQRLLGMKDVYLLSVHKALEWVSHPTPLSRIMDFKPWQCDFTPNQEDKEFCSFTFRPIKSTTTRRTTTTSRTRYHNTAEDQDNDIDDEEDRDHNGFAKENMEDSRGKGHRHHAHRPWFLRGTAVRSLPPVEVILLLVGLSVLMFVST